MKVTDQLEIRTFSSSMTPTGLVDDSEYFRWEHNWYTPDAWEMRINGNKPNATLLAIDGFIGFVGSEGTKIGMIETVEPALGEGGEASQEIVVSGRGVEAVLAQRIALYATDLSTNDGYDVQADTNAETAMRHYVNYNAINTTYCGANRVITGLTLATANSPLLGTNIDYAARFQPLPEILEDICRGQGLSYRLVWSGTGKNFTFGIIDGDDVSGSVVVSPEFDNAAALRYMNSILEEKNLIYLGGVGIGDTRTTAVVYSGSEPTGWDRKEYFADASDCSTSDMLADRGAQLLLEYAEQESMEFEYHQSNTFVYGTDFKLGDIVTVVYPDVAILVTRLVNVTEEYSVGDGLRLSMGVGNKSPDLVSLFKIMKRAIVPLQRR